MWLLCILENVNYKSCFRVDQELAQCTARCLLAAWSPFLPLPGLDTRLICGITPEEAGISDPVHTLQTWGLRGKSHVPPRSISFISGQARAEAGGGGNGGWFTTSEQNLPPMERSCPGKSGQRTRLRVHGRRRVQTYTMVTVFMMFKEKEKEKKLWPHDQQERVASTQKAEPDSQPPLTLRAPPPPLPSPQL